MKKVIQNLLGSFGYALRRTNTLQGGNPGSATRPVGELKLFFEDIRSRGFMPKGIIDVGANTGQWTMTALYVFPKTPVIMIEPQDEMERPLTDLCKFMPNCHYIKAGAGREAGELPQVISHDHLGSTFLPPSESHSAGYGEQRKTKVVTLDSILTHTFPDFIPDIAKLDIQGFELEALSGGTTLFGRTEILMLEVSLFPFHPGWPIVSEVISFIKAREYELYDIPGVARRPLDGALGHWNSTTVIGAMRLDGSTACMAIEGATDVEVFGAYVQQVLCPFLKPGDLVVMDNLAAHKSETILAMIRQTGAQSLFLPAYSPDFNPIEKMWSKLKQILRSLEARTLPSLMAAIGQALEAVTPQDAINWFASCGYNFI